MTYSECGSYYADVDVTPKKSITKNDIKFRLLTDPVLAKLAVKTYANNQPDEANQRPYLLKFNTASLVDLFQLGALGHTGFRVPIGSEAFYVRRLRETGLFESANLDTRGTCCVMHHGGVEWCKSL